ncbi:hypothetical protein IV203_011643 [Nitzschia inconspicua]|uniref:Uncharacterized protein n=1 Tax=Nitzschia inconspicua TaxID=303405 RepID=A0A9K3PJG9_9STRA|nr:hypothetical protein IV203_011643 [Nitzschia inconspicua]
MTSFSKEVQQTVLQNARRVQNQNYYYNGNGRQDGYWYGGGAGGGGEGEDWWLADYSIKMISCLAGEPFINYEKGGVESSTVIFRLCPVNSCSNNSTLGCDEGYGDYAIGVNTFAEAFAESVRDNYAYYEVNQMKEYFRECRQLEGGANSYYNGGYSYIGPACTPDGKNIRLGMFSDPYCQYESDSMRSMYGGNSMPFAQGGLIPETCIGCFSQNYENYEYEISDMCRRTVEDASYRCEKHMESSRNYYYGMTTQGCDYLENKVQEITSIANLSVEEMSFRGQRETVRAVLLFLTVACISAGVGLFCFQKKQARHAREAATGKDGLEIISPSAALESIQKGQQSAKDLMGSAAKKLKQSLHNTAKKVVDLTRSTSNAVKKRGTDGENVDRDDGIYRPMQENEGRELA